MADEMNGNGKSGIEVLLGEILVEMKGMRTDINGVRMGLEVLTIRFDTYVEAAARKWDRLEGRIGNIENKLDEAIGPWRNEVEQRLVRLEGSLKND